MSAQPEPVTEANLAKLNSESLLEGSGDHPPSSATVASPARSARSTLSFSQRTMESVNTMLIRSMVAVNGEPARLPTEKRKAPLSVATTAINFRGFVQKSGPVFVFQDAVEATLMWDDWLWTTMWMALWAVVSLHPRLFICVPPAIALTIMCNTFFIRFPITQEERDMSPGDALRASLRQGDILSEEPRAEPIEPRPVVEGELKYLLHMRDIQNMMRLIIDGYDHISPVVKFLNWSDVTRTLRIFQAAIVALVSLYFIAPYIPWRLTVFLGGELMLVHHHPWLKPALEAMTKQADPKPSTYKKTQRKHRLKQRVLDMLDEDRLPESVWQRGWKDMVLFENQRLQPGIRGGVEERRWNASNLKKDERRPWTRGSDGWSPSDEAATPGLHADQVPFALEEGYEWVEGDTWRIDWGGAWSSVGVDDQGYVYTDNSWSRPSPYAYGIDPKAPKRPIGAYKEEDDEHTIDEDEPGCQQRALTRRRRWLRRAVRIADAA
ncbi:peroxisomal membrane protein [Malassezia pachydermatis]|uniref:TECPR1-like DysF domain-containing protein n=1 Tax=Malassezia pachydermatis TaxID=77020 RepID=A0A0M9VPW5_9BASI|nr:hypothetical protein Malapachy_1059 [Malassezia pachydermatis]KOS14892.1 hypothetical protein Malapachy_1059 [Malassezia pachydermatis]